MTTARAAAAGMRPLRRHHVVAPRVALWGLVIVAAAAGVASWLRPTPAPRPTGAAPAPPELATIAEQAVCRWAAAIRNPNTDPDRAAPLEPPRCWTVASRRRGGDGWEVTVAVDLAAPVSGGRRPATWFAAIAVHANPTGGVATVGDPAIVPAPPLGDQPAERSVWQPVAAGDPLARTVTGFAAALLTGAGDVARYAAPTIQLVSVSPPPFTAVTVTRMVAQRSPGGVDAHVSITGTTSTGMTVPVAYELQLVERDDRWEITSVSAVTSVPAASATTTTSTALPPSSSPPTTALTGD